MQVQVDKHVPLPSPIWKRGNTLDKLRALKDVGDSVFFEGGQYRVDSIRSAMTGREFSRTLSGRKVDGGFRVWRIA